MLGVIYTRSETLEVHLGALLWLHLQSSLGMSPNTFSHTCSFRIVCWRLRCHSTVWSSHRFDC